MKLAAWPSGIGDFLHGLLGDDMVIGAQQSIGIADVQLFLPGLGLALGILNRHARLDQMIADRAHDVFFLVV